MDTSIAEHSAQRYNMGLAQALSDGTNTYIYGLGRIAQTNSTATDYFLPDALGSVRQLTNGTGAITYARAYDPYGVATTTTGASGTPYGYTGEYTSNDLVYLRARHYDPAMGRFLTRDTWSGNPNSPMSFNRWNYVNSNPINLLDPTGRQPGDSKYCIPLSGLDSQYCNNIVRGLHPETPMTVGDYILYDEFGPCYQPELDKILPHYAPTFTQFGWWYHYLLDRTPGWWNNQGRDHIYFRDVIAFALGVELSSKGSDGNLVGYAAGAFATKAWAPDQGFTNLLVHAKVYL